MDERRRQAERDAQSMKDQISSIKREKNDAKLSDVAASKNVEPLNKLSLKPKRVLRGHTSKVYTMHWSEEAEHQLVSAGQDGKLILWDAFVGLKVAMIALRSTWVMTCAYAPSGNMVACGGLDNVCTVYSRRGGEAEQSKSYRDLAAHTGFVSACRFLSDRQIITASGDRTCILWDIDTTSRPLEFVDHEGDIMSLSVSPDKNQIATGACHPDPTCKLWDIRTGKCTQTFYGHTKDINSVSFLPNGQLVGTGSDDFSCKLFDIRADRELATYLQDGSTHSITSIAFSSTGRLLFAGYDDNTVQIFDVLKGGRIAALTDHAARVAAVATHPQGYCLATGSWDSLIRCWC